MQTQCKHYRVYVNLKTFADEFTHNHTLPVNPSPNDHFSPLNLTNWLISKLGPDWSAIMNDALGLAGAAAAAGSFRAEAKYK